MRRRILMIGSLLSIVLFGCSTSVPNGFINCLSVEVKTGLVAGDVVYRTEYSATHEDIYEFSNGNGGYLYANKEIGSAWQIRVAKSSDDDPSTYEVYESVGYVGAVKVDYNKYLNIETRTLIEETKISKIDGYKPTYGTTKGNANAFKSVKEHGLFNMIRDDNLIMKKLENNQYYYLMFLDQMDTGITQTTTREFSKDCVINYSVRRG